MAHHAAHTMPTAGMQQCIEACLDCHARCIAVAVHCLDMGGRHASRAHQVALLDCADLCLAAANLMSRSSPLHPRACAVCAEACRASERACREIAFDDAMMLQCAEACQRCAEWCERTAAAAQ